MARVRKFGQRAGWIVASTIAMLCAAGFSPAAADPSTGATITPAERDEILAQHNKYRAEVGVPPLTWDNALAEGAQQWADAKEADGRFEHAPHGGGLGENYLGENLAGGEVKDATIRLADGTPSEKAVYQADPEASNLQNFKGVGHYTQIVWSRTTAVGCGYASANKLAFGLVVCRYFPAGNFGGQSPYLPPAAATPPPESAVPGAGPDPITPPGGTGTDPATPPDGTGTDPAAPPDGTGADPATPPDGTGADPTDGTAVDPSAPDGN